MSQELPKNCESESKDRMQSYMFPYKMLTMTLGFPNLLFKDPPHQYPKPKALSNILQ